MDASADISGRGDRLMCDRALPVLLALFTLYLSATAQAQNSALDLSPHAGKVVVIDFWASWCVPCRRSFPWLNAMHDKYGDDGLVIIGVNLDEAREDAEAFLSAYPANFEIWFDDTREVARKFDVMAMPMSLVIGRDGQRVATHFGFKVKKQDEYEAVLVAALEQRE